MSLRHVTSQIEAVDSFGKSYFLLWTEFLQSLIYYSVKYMNVTININCIWL